MNYVWSRRLGHTEEVVSSVSGGWTVERDWLIEQYSTQSIADIAALVDVSTSTVRRAMIRHNLPRRQRGDAARQRISHPQLADRDWLTKRYSTSTIAGIASEVEVASETVRRALDLHGIEVHTARRRPDRDGQRCSTIVVGSSSGTRRRGRFVRSQPNSASTNSPSARPCVAAASSCAANAGRNTPASSTLPGCKLRLPTTAPMRSHNSSVCHASGSSVRSPATASRRLAATSRRVSRRRVKRCCEQSGMPSRRSEGLLNGSRCHRRPLRCGLLRSQCSCPSVQRSVIASSPTPSAKDSPESRSNNASRSLGAPSLSSCTATGCSASIDNDTCRSVRTHDLRRRHDTRTN